MAAEVTEGTSDDTHLAADSKRQENAAGSSGYAPPVQEERRIANDGNAYTFREFLDHYGEEWSNSKWNAAQHTPPPAPPPQESIQAAAVNTLLAAQDAPPPAPPPQENVQAAAVNTLLTPRTAEEIRTSTRAGGYDGSGRLITVKYNRTMQWCDRCNAWHRMPELGATHAEAEPEPSSGEAIVVVRRWSRSQPQVEDGRVNDMLVGTYFDC